jgi:hypothetical protein
VHFRTESTSRCDDQGGETSVDQPTTPELKLSNLFVQNERPLLLVKGSSHDRRVWTTLPDSINDTQRSVQVAALKYAQPAGDGNGCR